MHPHNLYGIKKQLVNWGYPQRLVNKMKPVRILKCYQKERELQDYQTFKEKEYYLLQLLKNRAERSPTLCSRFAGKEG
ncbi:hypothetical protein DCCM_3844 [Desulfocucumis palustris]|uniref:Uncharacterized protein n=1 Tax=Desulfocucumis palustris TaxID=1898651 RepID=A0A2L2XFC5_9FIRM|nr:hypothetical protein DCCM_3844 [Desulfocucumis palustris]